jgi:hypothetical protein
MFITYYPTHKVAISFKLSPEISCILEYVNTPKRQATYLLFGLYYSFFGLKLICIDS